MKIFNLIVLFLISIFCLNCSSHQKETTKSELYIIENVNVITMKSDSILVGQDVYVENGKIKAIGKKLQFPKSKLMKTINGNDKYLIPGLIDTYTHIHEKSLVPEIANGVTTVVNAIGSPFQHGLKFLVDNDSIIGPRIVSFSPPIAGNPLFYHTQSAINDEKQTLEAIKEIDYAGYDGIFTYINIDSLIYEVALRQAKVKGLLTKGHIPFQISKDTYSKSTQSSYDNLIGLINPRNGETYDEEWLTDLAKKLNINRKYVIPTLTIHRIKATKSEDEVSINDKYVLPRQRAYWHLDENTDYTYNGAKKIVSNFHNNGVKLLIGTDGGYHFVPHGFSYAKEMKNFYELGMTNYEVLKAATVNAADYLKLSNEIGTIEENKIADMVLLSANPLENINNITNIEGVMIRGMWLDKNRIEELLFDLKREIENLPHRDRFKELSNINSDYNLYGEYDIIFKNMQCGAERIYLKETEKGKEWLSQNIIDPHCERETITKWQTSIENEVKSIELKRYSSAGKEEAKLILKGDSITIDAKLPFKKPVKFAMPYVSGELMGGPNTSINLDMDIIINFIMIFDHIKQMKVSQKKELIINKIELNGEEWGNDAVFGKTKYIFKRIESENDTSFVYEMTEIGFNSSEDFYFNALLTYNEHGNLETLEFNNKIIVKLKKP